MMRQDDKDVQAVKVEGGDDEKVDRYHTAEVMAEESLPILGWGPMGPWDHVFGDGALGHGESKLKEFTVDARSPPERMGATPLADPVEGA
jgi:hypothetical protein